MTLGDDDLASCAPLFSETFKLADQVAAQITPEDTERAMARIIESASHHYFSTACDHDQHGACRLICKFCESPCECECHSAER